MKGFTLLELLVIIVIFLIIILISLPTFKTYQPDLELSSEAREMLSDLRLAGQLAVTEQIDHGVRFLTDTDEYQIIKYGETEEVIKNKSLSQNVSFQQIEGFVNDEAVFNPYGAVRESGSVTLVNTKNTTTTVDVRPSGFVRIIK